jgi:cytochrome c biogenesis protein CcdA
MSKLSAPADKLVHEITGYINAQIDDVKLRSIKGLSKGTSAVAGLLLIFIIIGALVTALSFALVLWLGEVLNSYALAALITAGVLLIVLVVLYLLRNHLFKNSFVDMYTDIFFQKENKPAGLKSQEGLDMALWHAESRIKEKENDISHAFTELKDFYSLKHLVSEGLVRLFFGNKKKKKKE